MRNLEQYKLIGKIQISISKAKTLDEALKAGLEIVMEECNIDYSVVWLFDNGEKLLRPITSFSPVDITYKSYNVGEDLVGKAFEENYSVQVTDDVSSKRYAEELFSLEIESELIVPLANRSGKLGCVQFINKKGNLSMDSYTMDILDIMVTMIGICIESNEKIEIPWKMNNPVIRVRNLVKEFKNGDDSITRVLKGVNFDIYEGEFLVFLGESGCGKTTLLNIIGGIDNATDGEIYYKDFCVTKANSKELTDYRKNHIGYIFQSYNLMPNLNAKENVELISENVANPIDSMEVLKMVGLEDKADKYPSQLSGGQQQRVSIARAFAKRPDIIIADEPTAALDYTTSIGVLSVMEEVVKNGTMIIMVTHNEEITKMADRIIKIRDGIPYKIEVNRNPKHAVDLVW